MARSSRYSDAELATAIAKASSWRGVLRNLGLLDSSSGAIRHARARADNLALDYAHFSGQRGWTEARLRSAVRASHSWKEVSKKLGLDESASASTLPGHAARLRIDSRHLTAQDRRADAGEVSPSLANLDRAGPMLAAAWFTLCGSARQGAGAHRRRSLRHRDAEVPGRPACLAVHAAGRVRCARPRSPNRPLDNPALRRTVP